MSVATNDDMTESYRNIQQELSDRDERERVFYYDTLSDKG